MKVCLVSDDAHVAAILREPYPSALDVALYTPDEVDFLNLSSEREQVLIRAMIASDAVLFEWDVFCAPVMSALYTRIAWTSVPLFAVCSPNPDEQAAALLTGAHAVISIPISLPLLKAQVLAHRRTLQTYQAVSISEIDPYDQPTVLPEGAEVRSPGGDSAARSLYLNRKTRRLRIVDKEVHLTPKEFDLLDYLMQHPYEVLSRDQILDDVWDLNFDPGTNTVDVYIHYLRQLFRTQGLAGAGEIIETIRGRGYCFRPPVSTPAPHLAASEEIPNHLI